MGRRGSRARGRGVGWEGRWDRRDERDRHERGRRTGRLPAARVGVEAALRMLGGAGGGGEARGERGVKRWEEGAGRFS